MGLLRGRSGEHMIMNMEKRAWLIWSVEHGAWWAAEHKGYVIDRKSAGRYTYAEALRIVSNANLHHDADVPNEAMILDEDFNHEEI